MSLAFPRSLLALGALTVAAATALSAVCPPVGTSAPESRLLSASTVSTVSTISTGSLGDAASSVQSRALPRRWLTVAQSALRGVHGTSGHVTVRNVLTVTADTRWVRVRIGNPFGDSTLHLVNVHVGLVADPGSAALIPGTNQRATFRGERRATVAPGRSIWTDPILLPMQPFDQIAVSIYAPHSPINDHETLGPSDQYTPGSFISREAKNVAGRESGGAFGAFRPGRLWWVDVVAGRSTATGTVLTLGDSITAGVKVLTGGPRWSDVLAERFAALPADQRMAVANAGIGGNTVTNEVNPYDPTGECCGPGAGRRLGRDVLALPGISSVLLLEGTNDIGGGLYAAPVPASDIIAAMTKIAERVHEAGLPIVAATLLPMCNEPGLRRENIRQAVNDWIRTSGTFDAVIDFDAVLQDPVEPSVIRPDWRSDCYHPNAAGDQQLGNAIPLSVFGITV